MTSATAPSGVASASSFYPNANPYFAFNAASNGWITNGGAGPHWLQYQWPTVTRVCSYSIAPWDFDTFPSRCPTAWTLQGSNDGSTWTALDTKTGYAGTWAVGVTKTFTLAAPVSYLYYRLYITANGGDAYTGVRRFSLMTALEALWMKRSDGSTSNVCV
tara:strand:+ start:322 stop:801 length:480 start_codon:yes stop_codon:yes gene_type:complete